MSNFAEMNARLDDLCRLEEIIHNKFIDIYDGPGSDGAAWTGVAREVARYIRYGELHSVVRDVGRE